MERKHIFITEQQAKKLKDLAGLTGLPISELVRRALDQFLTPRRVYRGDHTTTE